ncbi:MAG: WG repeat-containing protein [Fluviicola sp.]|nr:WG repeat-containing protein [Fluviicola sp.]
MKLLILAGWLFLSCVAWTQSNPLPYVKNGKWSLVDSNGRLIKETDCSYIHQFDESGFTFFCENGGYGIMNSKGETVLKPIYADVQQKGFGHYQLYDNNGWIPYEPKGFRLIGNDTVQSFETLSSAWALVSITDKWYLEHLQTGNHWKINDSVATYKLLHDHLWLEADDTTTLLINGKGEMVLSGQLYLRSQNELHDVTFKRKHYLFDSRGIWPMTDIEQVIFEETALFVKTKKEGFYCGYDGSVILKGNYENITEFDQHYFQVRRNGLVTLLDRKTHQQALPFIYENMYPRLEGGFIVELEGNNGWIDKDFKTIIPCKYQRFTVRDQLAQVYELNYVGLFSLKTKKEILPAVYNTITQSGNRFKAIRNELITIIELNDQHAIVKTAKIDNAITVQTLLKREAPSRPPKFIDPRLFALGWFLDSNLVTPANEPAYYSVKWGLKNTADSIVIPASISELKYLPMAPFTLQYVGTTEFKRAVNGVDKIPSFKAVYLPTGKILNKNTFISYDSTDFRRRNFMRVSTTSGFSILRADATLTPLSYIEKGSNRNLLYCESKTVEVTEKESDEMTEITNLDFITNYLNLPHPTYVASGSKKIKGFIYPEGKWNFLKPDGTPLFNESFSFAKPFLGNQALVKVGKKWGVVNSDTLIIPAVYSAIERKIIDRDTFFVAQQAQGGSRLLDTSSTTLGNYTIAFSRGNALIMEIGGQKQLFDTDLKPLSEVYSTMKFLKSGLILAKIKKEYTLLTGEGTILYVGPEPPEDVLWHSFLVFKTGGSYQVKDLSDKVIADRCSSAEAKGNYMLIRRNGATDIFDLRGNLLIDEVTGSILVDTLGNGLAIVEKNKVIVYEGPERRMKLKGFVPTHFISGKFLCNTKDSCILYSYFGEKESVLPHIDEVAVLEDASIFLKTSGKVNFLFDREWKPVLPEEKKFRQLMNVGPAIYAYNTAEGKTVLYNAETNESDSTYRNVTGYFEQDRLLVTKGTRLSYLDEHFKPITARTFSQAIPFAGKHAAIADQRGWTLIDHQCNSLTYPNYGEIKALNAQLFKTQKLPLYGLYNSQGKLLIPVEYEQIRFLSNGIILCVKEGAFYYFRKDGNPLPML